MAHPGAEWGVLESAVVSGGSHSLAGDVVATFTEMTWILDPGL